MLQVLPPENDWKSLLGASLGKALQQGAGNFLQQMSRERDYAEKLGLQKAKARQQLDLYNQIMGAGGNSQQIAQGHPTDGQFVEGLNQNAPQMEALLGRELTPADLDALWKQGQGSFPSAQQNEPLERGSSKMNAKQQEMLAWALPNTANALARQEKYNRETIDKSWTPHQKYLDNQRESLSENLETIEKLKLENELVKTGKLNSPTFAALAEKFGFDPIGYSAPTQLYAKAQKDLAGGFTHWLGTAKSNQQEFKIFLDKWATLKNTDEGKLLINEYLLNQLESKNVEAQTAQEMADYYADHNLPLPKNFENKVLEKTKIKREELGIGLKELMDRAKVLD